MKNVKIIKRQKVVPSSFNPSQYWETAAKLIQAEVYIIPSERRIFTGFFDETIPKNPIIKSIIPSVKK